MIRVGLAQINPMLGDVGRNLDIFEEYLERARKEKVQLLIFPELGLTGYFLKDAVPDVAIREGSPVLERLKAMSREMDIITGFVEESDDHLFYNAGIYLERGQVRHIHRKVYLPTYGMFEEQRYFARGRKIRAFDTRFGRFGMLICEDLWHLSTAYVVFQDGADFLVNLGSSPSRGLSGDGKLDIIDTWETLNKAYAGLFSQFVFFVNRVGYEDGINFWGGSEIFNPEGKRVIKGSYFDEMLVVGEVDTGDLRRVRIATTLLRDEDLDLTMKELLRIQQQRFL